MDTCPKTGIVRLEDLPSDEIFVQLKSEFHKILESKIRDYGIERFERKISSGRKVGHWLSDGSLIRFDILLKVLDYFDMDYKNKIEFIRGKDGYKIKNPKLPFDFTMCQGCRVVAGILGDGGIPSNRSNPYYTNSDKNLINGFIEDIKYVFGDIEFNTRDYTKENMVTTILEFSSLIEKIFLRIGLKKGKKVETNQNVPNFIFNLDNNKKYSFFSQFFDDEGSVNPNRRHICLTAGCLKKYEASNLLLDMQKILITLDIDSSIYPCRVYPSSKGEDRRIWRLQINGQFQLRQLQDNLNLRHVNKKKKLNALLGSIKFRTFRKKESLSIYLDIIKKIQNSKGYFTSLDLSRETEMAVGSCRNTIIRFRKKGLIKCIKQYSINPHQYGRYILNEHNRGSTNPFVLFKSYQ